MDLVLEEQIICTTYNSEIESNKSQLHVHVTMGTLYDVLLIRAGLVHICVHYMYMYNPVMY